MKADEARLSAVRAARDVESGALSQEALSLALQRGEGAEGARGRTTELFYGILRWQGRLDWTLAPLSRRPLKALDPETRACLRLGVLEMAILGHPAYAVVDAVVEVAKVFARPASTLVNAVLRRVAEEGERPYPPDPVAALAVRESHPVWLVTRWERRVGLERTQAWCEWANRPPELAVRVNRLKGSPRSYLDRYAPREARTDVLSEAALVLPPSPVDRIPGFREGWVSVQGIGAQAVTDAVPLAEGAAVADVCAGKGTKTLALLERAPGIRLLAMDLEAGELERIPAEALRLGLEAPTMQVADARRPPGEFTGRFRTVLVDAPCSGLGTLRRHPEIRWRRTPGDLRRSAHLQKEILEGAQTLVADGGCLVYAVCTMEEEETSEVRSSFMEAHPEFSPRPFSDAPTGERLLTPDRDGCEGFYVAQFTKGRRG